MHSNTALLVILGFAVFHAHAQNADPAPDQPASTEAAESAELQQLKERAEIEEQKKLIAEYQVATEKAKFGESTTRGPETTLSLKENAGYFADLQAYTAMRNAAAKIATAVDCTKKNQATAIQVVHLSQTTDAVLLSAVKERIETITTEASFEATQPAKLASTESAGAVLFGIAAFADLVGMFRSETVVSGKEITISDQAVAAELAAALIAQGCKNVSIPGLHLGARQTPAVLGELQDMRAAVAAMAKNREDVAKLTADQDQIITKLTADLAAAKKAKTPTAAIEKALSEAKTLVQNHNARIRRIDAISAAATTLKGELVAPAEGKPTLLERIISASIVGDISARYLAYQVSSSGGEYHVTQALWMSGRVNYVGGMVLTWFLVEAGGNLKATGATTAWAGQSYKPKEFRGQYTSDVKNANAPSDTEADTAKP